MDDMIDVKSQPEADQSRAGKIFLWVFALLIVGSVGATFWRVMIRKDYIIEAQADCDPTVEKCFVYICDPQTETTCTGNPDEDTAYFKKVNRIAANIPLCDPVDESCQALVCPEGEKDCTVSFCDEKTKDKDDECSDPEQYNIDNPAEEETACADGDEECLAAQADAVTCKDPSGTACASAADRAAGGAATTCDLEQDPTCVDAPAAADGSDGAGTDATATDSTTKDNPAPALN